MVVVRDYIPRSLQNETPGRTTHFHRDLGRARRFLVYFFLLIIFFIIGMVLSKQKANYFTMVVFIFLWICAVYILVHYRGLEQTRNYLEMLIMFTVSIIMIGFGVAAENTMEIPLFIGIAGLVYSIFSLAAKRVSIFDKESESSFNYFRFGEQPQTSLREDFLLPVATVIHENSEDEEENQ